MNLRANHHKFEIIEIATTYSILDSPNQSITYISYSSPAAHNSALVPELVFRYNVWHLLIIACILAFIGLLFAIITSDAGWIAELAHIKGNFFERNGGLIFVYFCMLIPWLLFAKHFADIRYLLFQDDKVILQSRALGRRIYDAKDLKFHVLELGTKPHRYHLEVELPDPSIEEHRRLLILETAARKSTMDGLIATLLPLLRGDTAPYLNAKKRQFEFIAADEKPTWWQQWVNIENHTHVWFLNYKVNQFLLWLVHGSRKKLMAKEESLQNTTQRR